MSPTAADAESFHRLLKENESPTLASDAGTAYDSSDYELRSPPPSSKWSAQRSSIFPKLLALVFVHLKSPKLWRASTAPKKKLRPTAWLDGLRGYAALNVYIFHVTLFWYGGSGRGWGQTDTDWGWYRLPFIRNIYAAGHADVGIFFVISGYVLTQKSLSLIRSRNFDALYPTVASAVFRRWFRLWIPVFVSTFLVMLMTYGGLRNSRVAQAETFNKQLHHWFLETDRLVNPFSYRDRWGTLLDAYDWATWTIPLEFYGSIICYLVTIAVSRMASNATRAVTVALVAFYALFEGSWFTFCFLAGMLIADHDLHVNAQKRALDENLSEDPDLREKKKHTQAGTVFWTLLFIFAMYLVGTPDHGSPSIGYQTLFSLVPETWIAEPHNWYAAWAGVFLVLSINRHPYIYRFFETSFAQFLARISYALYLCHNVMYFFLMENYLIGPVQAYFGVGRNEFGGIELAEGRPNGYEWAFFTCFVIETAATVFVAIWFEKLVDAPSVKFAKFFENWVIAAPKQEDASKERE